MFYMKSNPVDPITKSRGSVVLVASTSGYFGGTGVVSYISSKHGTIGLLRSSQKVAAQHAIRVNGVAPFFTPTYITGGYSDKWKEKGLQANTTTDVANAIVSVMW
jgi:NAD(P)-dependent dehydrogenase (short-subunit alcohol dehydrogenase family)